MTDLIDKNYFLALAEEDPREVCKRGVCTYNTANEYYELAVWDDYYRIYPSEYRIESVNANTHSLHDYFYLVIIYYILKAREIEVANEWISEKDLPGGTTFFRGPHTIPSDLISSRFEGDIDGFRERCEQLNGAPLNMADIAFVFRITPRIPVAVLYWESDDEFPAESKLLFDKTIKEHFTLDIVYALAVAVCDRLGKATD